MKEQIFYAVIFISRKLETKFPVELEDYQDGVWNSKGAGSTQRYDWSEVAGIIVSWADREWMNFGEASSRGPSSSRAVVVGLPGCGAPGLR